MTNPHKLKELQVRLAKLEASLHRLEQERRDLARVYGNTLEYIQNIRGEIAKMKVVPVVSEHALLRYLERKFRLDLEKVRKDIMPDEIIPIIERLYSGKIPVDDSHVIVVKDMVIVSVICNEEE